ncbi:MAG: sigma 54-interacting transcriptional regulator [Bryobacteraceae bacterium]
MLLESVDGLRGELNQLPGFREIVGRSPALVRVLDISARVANRPTPILIVGETGTGKDLLARAIHENSGTRDGAFTKINCGLLGADSISLTLSSLQAMAPGTLYLDDVASLPPHCQLELMQLFQEGEASRTGDPDRASARVIASTSSTGNLAQNAKLRPDLYYRLSVVPIHLPPLRERKEDLPELVRFFVDRIATRHKVSPTPVSPALHERLAHYGWPGNIRELENAVERMLLLAAGFVFSEDSVPTSGDEGGPSMQSLSHGLPENGVSLAQVERELLVAALRKFAGNQTKAARYLNISRRTLIYRMGKHNLRRTDRVASL